MSQMFCEKRVRLSAHRFVLAPKEHLMKRGTMIVSISLALSACGGEGATGTSPSSSPPTSAPETVPVASADPGTGCQAVSTRYPWGKAELRTWSPRSSAAPQPSDKPGVATGSPFEARMIWSYGQDSAFSSRTVELELTNGCRRRFRVSSFFPNDVALIDAAVAAHPLEPDRASYAVYYREGRATQDALVARTLGKYETQHFTFWYGTNTEGESYKWLQARNVALPRLLVDAGDWMEKIWLFDRDLLGAPMPYANVADRRKINIYICGTGLAFAEDGGLKACGASASDAVWIDLEHLQFGSTTAIHEFGHVIQYYTGGFRDRPEAGPIWETGAEWNSFVLSPDNSGFLPVYLNNLENGPLWSNARYAAHPFFSFLYEQDRTRPFFWRAWTENLRNPDGSSKEDFLQAFVRLGQTAGIYPNGFASFADDAGWFGARLAAMDFIDQRALLDVQAAADGRTLISHLDTPLQQGGSGAEYLSPPARPLLEFGTHLVRLTPTGGTVRVSLSGATATNQAAWRFALVSVGDDGRVRYSRLGAANGTGGGDVAWTPPTGGKLYLAVTATPGVYETLGWQPRGPVKGTRFPYRVRITGATLRTGDPARCAANLEPGVTSINYNTNGNSEERRPC